MATETRRRPWLKEPLLLGLLAFSVFDFPRLAALLSPLIGEGKPSVEWAPLPVLAGQHIGVVLLSSTASFLVAFSLGAASHLYGLKGLQELLLNVGSFGESFPTAAVIALAVPALGYGFEPLLLALFLYGLLPVLMNTIQGLTGLDRDVVQAAEGMGLTRVQRLLRVELPLAAPMILAGVRTAVIINIAAASIGSVVGAGGLGMPIVSGIRTFDPVLILKGTIPIALLALLADSLFRRAERRLDRRVRSATPA